MSNLTIDELKESVYTANIALVQAGLVVLTWGNASAVDRERGVVAIKPSGVAYDVLTPKDIVLVSLETGELLPGETMRASSDTPTHVHLYQQWPEIGGIAHTHSRNATSWAQACREIPCYGTTHADTFYGPVPLARPLTSEEIDAGYELNTGVLIVEHFRENHLDPDHVPGIILSFHAPFAWGKTAAKAVEHAIVLEEVAGLALRTEQINAQAATTPQSILDKHFRRKHGADAYYGQPK
ncbi:L-ribulose-5-phosphate 4-epimerase [Capsulimonas corticalis]|uniref:L-ribulose-5-phosphate 4-epimerase n=1 Tax=Capsulimonas corticalis TaxID=2219043 RepID=A0A402D369_9BACT|nr:L-ribulose-5-phosphate 4-epimerase AraD [Capsulimonas corticalis]BDI28526.1 L-ribulose-5-phosphate 4-epimerase [Capsulimonas corticalis]